VSILPEQTETLMDDGRNIRKITDPTVLITVAKRMMNKVTVEANDENRTKEMIARWQVSNLLNAVDESTWHNMVSAALDGHKKTLVNQQPNGDWQPSEYEIEVREMDGRAMLMLGVRWTDERGEEDVQYHNGAPVVNLNVTTKAAPQDNTQMLELLKMLAAGQLSANEAIAKLQSEPATVQPDVEIKAATTESAPKSNPRTGKRKLARKSPSA
jgi:hypothetical protein